MRPGEPPTEESSEKLFFDLFFSRVDGKKCERCWKYFPKLKDHICDRCNDVIQ